MRRLTSRTMSTGSTRSICSTLGSSWCVVEVPRRGPTTPEPQPPTKSSTVGFKFSLGYRSRWAGPAKPAGYSTKPAAVIPSALGHEIGGSPGRGHDGEDRVHSSIGDVNAAVDDVDEVGFRPVRLVSVRRVRRVGHAGGAGLVLAPGGAVGLENKGQSRGAGRPEPNHGVVGEERAGRRSSGCWRPSGRATGRPRLWMSFVARRTRASRVGISCAGPRCGQSGGTSRRTQRRVLRRLVEHEAGAPRVKRRAGSLTNSVASRPPPTRRRCRGRNSRVAMDGPGPRPSMAT